jgi:putative transposase
MIGVTELAIEVGARASCDALGVPRASYYRWTSPPSPKEPLQAAVRAPSHRALSDREKQGVLDTLHSDRFLDRSPAHVVAELLCEGIWLSSERTMYRILKAQGETQGRQRQRTHPAYVKPQLVATGPNQVWTWDITKVRSMERGVWFHLFVLLDIFSRCVVGWTLTRRPSAAVAGHLLQETLPKHQVERGTLTVHNDRGTEFIADDVTRLFETLEVARSFSRPRTSNDNAYSESQFKTTKYHPDYPGVFAGFEPAWAYFESIFEWYNTQHRHSGIAWLTPEQVHTGQAREVLIRHQTTKDAAYAVNPERFVNGPPRIRPLPKEVWINAPIDVGSDAPRH